MADEHLLGLSTCPDRALAEEIAGELVERGHAACVNIVPGLTSVYRWRGETHRDEEVLLLMKTTRQAWPALQATVLELHSEELPEIIAVPVTGGLSDYLAWVTYQTSPDIASKKED
ncbi:periplasmic divalent cation tolerance protein [Natronocella acetinitrilica]|uniref:Periplasmic divalent cation tolerance protein n=1 Tax=Natronocella acetinitrilica TaxID=414046 RepID=A0AAE3G1V2_9GAMM|nr:divalent-cation tolerance protein CutA [Natronocella acetinitrilica]MCP1673181.1 periplasmic divalent cation tolerance protein [Natronocella acetinitrilica]